MPKCLSYPFSIFLLFFFLLAPPSPAQQTKPIGPRIKIEPQLLDFGIIEGTEAITHTATVHNNGDQPLKAWHSCSCGLLANPWQCTIPRGGSAELPMTFTPARLGPGNFERSMMIHCNDPLTPKITVTAKGFHRPLVYLDPPVIQFGEVPAGNGGKVLVTIVSRDKDVQLESVQSGHPNITATTIDSDALGAPDPDFPGRHVLELSFPSGLPSGAIAGNTKFTIRARHPDRPNDPPQEIELTAPVIAQVNGHIVAEPRFIRVAQTFPDETFIEKTIVSSDNGPFKVTACTVTETTLPGVTARTIPIEGKNAVELILEGKGTDTLGMFRGCVELTTDIPNESPLRVQFNGFVRAKPPAP